LHRWRICASKDRLRSSNCIVCRLRGLVFEAQFSVEMAKHTPGCHTLQTKNQLERRPPHKNTPTPHT
jgi:hypothetical protein